MNGLGIKEIQTTGALVVGAGPATGGAIARRFAQGGHIVVATHVMKSKLWI